MKGIKIGSGGKGRGGKRKGKGREEEDVRHSSTHCCRDSTRPLRRDLRCKRVSFHSLFCLVVLLLLGMYDAFLITIVKNDTCRVISGRKEKEYITRGKGW